MKISRVHSSTPTHKKSQKQVASSCLPVQHGKVSRQAQPIFYQLNKTRSGCIFLKIIKRVAFHSGRIGMSIPDRMESSFHSGWNEMPPFHSGQNGMAIPFQPEWNELSIPAGMEWSHFIPAGVK